MTNLLDNFRILVNRVRAWEGWTKMNFANIGINNLLFWTIITLFGSMIVNLIIFFTMNHIITLDNYTKLAWSYFFYLLMIFIPHAILINCDFLEDDDINWWYYWICFIVGAIFLFISFAPQMDNKLPITALLAGAIALTTVTQITTFFGAVFEQNGEHIPENIAISQIIQQIVLIGTTLIAVILV